jgi:predicted dehydrogenase
MTAYRLHNESGTVEVLERIRSGEIGDPRIFAAVFSFVASPDDHCLKVAYWGGPLQDIGVYCLNAARHIFAAEPIEAVAVRSFGNDSAVVGDRASLPSGNIVGVGPVPITRRSIPPAPLVTAAVAGSQVHSRAQGQIGTDAGVLLAQRPRLI